MKLYSKMDDVRISNIKPQGWLKKFLELQASGLTGYMENAGFPYNSVGWDRYEIDTTALNDNPGWWVYEQTAYWVDGAVRCGELINDQKLKRKVNPSLEFVLAHQDKDGYLGPKFLKESTFGKETDGYNRWPHVVFFRAMMAKYSATKDQRYVDALYKHYMHCPHDYSLLRNVDNIEGLLWVYIQTGDKRLLDMAEAAYKSYNEKCEDDNCEKAHLSRNKAYAHGVTYNEYAKLGAMLYICTGKTKYLKPTLNAYKKIDRYQMLVDGCHCSNEFMVDNDYMQSHETCDITDYIWAISYVLQATGDGAWADKIERCVLNAGMGAVTEDFRAVQYLSCPNQLILDSYSNHNVFYKGAQWMTYRPNPCVECCPGNANRFFPIYCGKMWMQHKRSVFAVLYGASEVTYGTRQGKMRIIEETNYPFEDTIRMRFEMKKARKVRFHLRIPGWCKNPTITVNGEPVSVIVHKGFAVVERIYQNGDILVLTLPSEIRVQDYHGQGIYVEKGPLLYTYGMYGRREVELMDQRQTPDFPAWNMYPDQAWNYALCEDEKSAEKLEVRQIREMSEMPWDIRNVPLGIEVSARKVPGWELEHVDRVRRVTNLHVVPWKRTLVKGKFMFTPRLPSEEMLREETLEAEEKIMLVPYGAAKLRLTIFPKVK